MVLATVQPSRPCRSKISTTMQVICAFKERFSAFTNVLYVIFFKRVKLNPICVILYYLFFCLDCKLPIGLLDLANYFKVDLSVRLFCISGMVPEILNPLGVGKVSVNSVLNCSDR